MSAVPHFFLQRRPNMLIGLRIYDGQIAVVAEQPGDEELLLEYLQRAPALDTMEPLPANVVPDGASRDANALAGLLAASSASFMVAQTCNLRCHYCFAGEGDYGRRSMMGWEQAKLIVDQLFASGHSEDPVHINFFGGEPMVAWPVIERVVAHARDLASRHQRDLEFSMTTNATLVTPQRAAFAAEHAFSVLVSIDGTKADHDSARPDIRGQGSWDSVVAGSRMLLEALGADRVAARATLRAGHAPYAEMEQALAEIGFQQIHLCVEGVHPSRMAADAIPASDWQRQVAHAEAVADEYGPEELAAGRRAAGYDPLSEHIAAILQGSIVARPCGVGDAAIAVDTAGAIFPCHRFVGDARFALGKLGQDTGAGIARDSVATERFIALYKRVAADCEPCLARRFCAGGCAHEALERLDHGLPPHDEAECDAIRGGVLAAIWSVARHVDAGLMRMPVLLDRRALNAEYRAAVFQRRRRRGQSQRKDTSGAEATVA